MRKAPIGVQSPTHSGAALPAIVEDYQATHGEVPLRELAYFEGLPTYEESIAESAMCRIRGRRLSHQRRIPRAVLEEARRRLLANADALRSAPTFEELHDLVEAIIGPIAGIGDLTVYDITLRIGAKLGREPTLIYLHAGTRKGAAALGLDAQAKTIALEDLPPELRVLTAREAEDVLCIYKDYLKSGDPMDLDRACGEKGRSRLHGC